MTRWCQCKTPKTWNLTSRTCLICGKLRRLKPKRVLMERWKTRRSDQMTKNITVKDIQAIKPFREATQGMTKEERKDFAEWIEELKRARTRM